MGRLMSDPPPSTGWATFPTALGHCGIAWEGSQVLRLCLPERTGRALHPRLIEATGSRRPATPPAAVGQVMERVRRHFAGQMQDFSAVPLQLADVPAFWRQVYAAARAIPAGETRTYGQLASAIGSPGSARAVGQALGHNPVALIIPCHRVQAAGGKSGGFSAPGGLATKARMLALEGCSLEPPLVLHLPRALRAAQEALGKADPALGRLMRGRPPLALERRGDGSAYGVLLRAIVHQQLRPAAAQTILKRVQALFPGAVVPHPQALLATPDADLRAAGLSRAKTAALKDLARHAQAGDVPSEEAMRRMTDDAIVKRLTGIRGIGQWTAEMLLIFYLGRQDVLPVHDYALRAAMQRAFRLRSLPTQRHMERLGQRWRPYRTVAALALWDFLATSFPVRGAALRSSSHPRGAD